MKKSILIILSALSLVCHAQINKLDTYSPNGKNRTTRFNNTTMYAYSIGFKFLSFEEFPKILDQTNADILRRSQFNGVILKYNDNQMSYRLSGNFYSGHVSFKNSCEECETISGRLTDNHIKIGFEKNIIYATVQPYFGLDLGIKRSVFKGDSYNAPETMRIASVYGIKTEKNGVSLSPLVGIKLNAVNHLTIVAESTMDIFYSYERQEKAGNTTSLQKYYKWEYLLKPLGMLTLQYNFGEIY